MCDWVVLVDLPEDGRRVRHNLQRVISSTGATTPTTRSPWRKRRWPPSRPRSTSVSTSWPSRPVWASCSARPREPHRVGADEGRGHQALLGQGGGPGPVGGLRPRARCPGHRPGTALVAGLPDALSGAGSPGVPTDRVRCWRAPWSAVEALVRWGILAGPDRAGPVHRPGRGDRPDRPARRWVLREACEDAAVVAGENPAPGDWSASTWPPGRPTPRPSWTRSPALRRDRAEARSCSNWS